MAVGTPLDRIGKFTGEIGYKKIITKDVYVIKGELRESLGKPAINAFSLIS